MSSPAEVQRHQRLRAIAEQGAGPTPREAKMMAPHLGKEGSLICQSAGRETVGMTSNLCYPVQDTGQDFKG